MRWLVFLKEKNNHYKDIQMDYTVLSSLSADGSIIEYLHPYTDADDNDGNDFEADDSRLKPGST